MLTIIIFLFIINIALNIMNYSRRFGPYWGPLEIRATFSLLYMILSIVLIVLSALKITIPESVFGVLQYIFILIWAIDYIITIARVIICARPRYHEIPTYLALMTQTSLLLLLNCLSMHGCMPITFMVIMIASFVLLVCCSISVSKDLYSAIRHGFGNDNPYLD